MKYKLPKQTGSTPTTEPTTDQAHPKNSGSVCFGDDPKRKFLRHKPHPREPYSSKVTINRKRYGQAIKQFKNLTPLERQPWTNEGKPNKLSGFACFLQRNMNRQISGLEITKTLGKGEKGIITRAATQLYITDKKSLRSEIRIFLTVTTPNIHLTHTLNFFAYLCIGGYEYDQSTARRFTAELIPSNSGYMATYIIDSLYQICEEIGEMTYLYTHINLITKDTGEATDTAVAMALYNMGNNVKQLDDSEFLHNTGASNITQYANKQTQLFRGFVEQSINPPGAISIDVKYNPLPFEFVGCGFAWDIDSVVTDGLCKFTYMEILPNNYIRWTFINEVPQTSVWILLPIIIREIAQ